MDTGLEADPAKTPAPTRPHILLARNLAKFFGNRVPEIAIEVSEETLRRYGLRFDEVAIRAGVNSPVEGSIQSPFSSNLPTTLGRMSSRQL